MTRCRAISGVKFFLPNFMSNFFETKKFDFRFPQWASRVLLLDKGDSIEKISMDFCKLFHIFLGFSEFFPGKALVWSSHCEVHTVKFKLWTSLIWHWNCFRSLRPPSSLQNGKDKEKYDRNHFMSNWFLIIIEAIQITFRLLSGTVR